jgi:hypothetical protein
MLWLKKLCFANDDDEEEEEEGEDNDRICLTNPGPRFKCCHLKMRTRDAIVSVSSGYALKFRDQVAYKRVRLE